MLTLSSRTSSSAMSRFWQGLRAFFQWPFLARNDPDLDQRTYAWALRSRAASLWTVAAVPHPYLNTFSSSCKRSPVDLHLPANLVDVLPSFVCLNSAGDLRLCEFWFFHNLQYLNVNIFVYFFTVGFLGGLTIWCETRESASNEEFIILAACDCIYLSVTKPF